LPREQDATFAHTAREQLDFLVQIHGLERIVLITHFGCAAYAQRLQKSAEECLWTQMDDLKLAASALHRSYSTIRIEAYVAMRQGRTLSFHELGLQ
jgi:hypothetical protein